MPKVTITDRFEALLREVEAECISTASEPELKSRYIETLRFINMARRNYNIIKNYAELKAKSTMIYNPETKKLILATPLQLSKLAIMKGDIEDDYNSELFTKGNFKPGTSDNGGKDGSGPREIADLSEYPVIRKALSDRVS